MATVTVHRDFGAQENKIGHCFHFSPIYLPWSGGTRWLEVFSPQATCSRPDAMCHIPWPTSFYWDPSHTFPAPLIKHGVAITGTQNRSVAAQWRWKEVTRYKREEANFQVDYENDLLIKEKTAAGSWEMVWKGTKAISTQITVLLSWETGSSAEASAHGTNFIPLFFRTSVRSWKHKTLWKTESTLSAEP